MGLILLGTLVSSKLNRMRALSINEVIERNYGATARLVGAVLTIIYTVALTVVQVVAMGSILAGLFDMNLTMAMALAGALLTALVAELPGRRDLDPPVRRLLHLGHPARRAARHRPARRRDRAPARAGPRRRLLGAAAGEPARPARLLGRRAGRAAGGRAPPR